MLDTLLTVATASLVGSLHCAAMCGGLVSFTCGTSENPRVAQAFYHASRLTVYVGLGAVAGYVGQSLNERVDIAGYQNLTGLIAGSAMIGWAMFSLWRRWLATRSDFPRTPPAALGANVQLSTRKPRTSLLSVWFAKLHTLPTVLRGGLLGLTSAILPCGWLYAFVTAAAGQGSPAGGALLMGAFWLGTIPMLVGLGGLVSLLGQKARSYLPQLSIVVLLALGLGTVLMRNPVVRAAQASSSSDTPAHHSCH